VLDSDDDPFLVDLLNPKSFPVQIAVFSKGNLVKGWEIDRIDEKYSKVKITLNSTVVC